MEILLKEKYYLSIEACGREDKISASPAFFRRNVLSSEEEGTVRGDDDPAMCKVEVATVKNRRSVGSPANQSIFEGKASDFLAVFFRFDGNVVYQVDSRKVVDIEIVLGTEEGEVKTPPCLLIQFESCLFRIFPLYDSFSSADQFSNLDAMKTRLAEAILSENAAPFPVMAPLVGSPLGSSRTNSLEQQAQKQTSREISHFETNNDDINIEKKDSSETECSNDIYTSITRKRMSMKAAREGLEMIQTMLELPPSSMSDASFDLQDQASKLLTSVPENLASSYCTKNHITTALFAQNSNIKKYRNGLREITKEFLPSGRTRKRSRRTLSSEESGTAPMEQTQTNKASSAEECVSRTKNLLLQHKEALWNKYNLALLPTKG